MNREQFLQDKASQIESFNKEKKRLEADIASINRKILILEADIRNYIFDSIEEAMEEIEDQMREEASEACEGSHCMGNDIYEQEFVVDGIKYKAIGKFEYNRHDKRYYYVDGADFEYEEEGPYEPK